MTHHQIECPHCGKLNDRQTMLGGNGAPKDGDASICVQCAQWSVFELTAFGMIQRMPTPTEAASLMADERCQAVQALTVLYASRRGQ
jgi:hypothetical protein